MPGARKRPAAVRQGHRSRLTPLPDELSAKTTVTRQQVMVFRWVGASVLIMLPVAPIPTLIVLIAVATALYLGAFIFRVRIFWRALRDPSEIRISDERADDLWDHSLPAYTVLVPAFREPEVIAQVIASLGQLDYPAERLDVKLLLEEDDTETIAAAEAARPPRSHPDRASCRPASRGPSRRPAITAWRWRAESTSRSTTRRTSPSLCSSAARWPRSAASTSASPASRPSSATTTPSQNSITRWFTTEYAMWFSQLLPGLVQDSAPLPLGGTSNHFRRAVLDEIGGWDAYNVTEDADLGIRLHRLGYRTAVLDSTTFEEANSDFVNWVKQRSRWYKGYMQTWLVHMRHPVQLFRELGLGGFIGFNLFVGGTPLLALLNPFFWALTAVWILGRIELIDDLFPSWLYYIGVGCFAFGNLLFIYTNMIAARQHGRPELVLAAVLSPIYWVMMSIAAVKALVQLITAPTFWEKTQHGLDKKQPAKATSAGA